MALPFVTASLPGTGGLLRAQPEDFVVEELPAYVPSGTGEHVYLWVEKRGLTTLDAARVLAGHAGLRDRDVGIAGLKDKRAVTRQWFSLALKDDARFLGFTAPGLTVLSVARHGNKLKTGHLRGNRFRLALRAVHPDGAARARAILAVLARQGVPNAYGPQRFGRDGSTARLGLALLQDVPHPDRVRAARDRALRRLALSAFQSELFNALLTRRLLDGTWNRALAGDVLQKVTGAAFVCEKPAIDQARLDAFELSVAGPIFGPRMLASRDAARAHELAVLQEAGIDEALFVRGGELTQGARRPLRVLPTEVEVEGDVERLEVRFCLPRGSYASVVMAEVMKHEVALEGDDGGGDER
jgi:tRNA pseudouridine13 synthase